MIRAGQNGEDEDDTVKSFADGQSQRRVQHQYNEVPDQSGTRTTECQDTELLAKKTGEWSKIRDLPQ